MKRLRNSNDPLVHAGLYEWVLNKIDSDHPLYGVSYIGQVVRPCMSLQKIFEERTKEHICDSKRNPKFIGLHWAIQSFGIDAFTRQLIANEKCHAPRIEAMNWANERERQLISERGGIMQDTEPDTHIQQTFNLTKGGQGDARVRWHAIQLICKKRLEIVWPAFKSYYEREGHLRIRRGHIENSIPIGKIVSRIRSKNYFVNTHPEFKQWLDDHHFEKDANEAHFIDVWNAFKSYYEREGHLRIPQLHIEDSIPIGNIVNNIRSNNYFVNTHPEFAKWLKMRNFLMHTRNATKNRLKWDALSDIINS